ncbi:MAG: tetratricopeptide repeat protein [Gemmataceae bacterium]
MASSPEPIPRRPWLALGVGLVVVVLVAGWIAWPRVQAARALRQAREALRADDPDRAGELLAVCVRMWPDDADVRLLASRAARLAGRLPEAREHLEAVPDEPVSRSRRLLERALLEATDGRLREYEPFLRRQLDENPEEAPAILDVLAYQYMRTERLPEASRELGRWLELEPDNVEALVRRAWVADRLFNKEAAARDYQAVLERQPYRDPVRQRLGELLLESDSTRAMQHFEELLKRHPDDPAALLGLARARVNRIELAEAEQVLDRLQQVQADNAGALVERGRIALARQQPAEAEKWLRQAIARNPYERESVYRLIRALQMQNKTDELARAKQQLERIDEDARKMTRLMPQVSERPRDPALRTEIGLIFLRNGMDLDGLRWLNTALECAPNHAPAHEALVEYYTRKGDAERAAHHRQMLARLRGASR